MNETGSIGIIETKYAEFKELTLNNGSVLSPVVIAYETYGTLSPSKNNAILICHALSGDAHAAGYHSESDKNRVGGTTISDPENPSIPINILLSAPM